MLLLRLFGLDKGLLRKLLCLSHIDITDHFMSRSQVWVRVHIMSSTLRLLILSCLAIREDKLGVGIKVFHTDDLLRLRDIIMCLLGCRGG